MINIWIKKGFPLQFSSTYMRRAASKSAVLLSVRSRPFSALILAMCSRASASVRGMVSISSVEDRTIALEVKLGQFQIGSWRRNLKS
jgi:hypothetical protein